MALLSTLFMLPSFPLSPSCPHGSPWIGLCHPDERSGPARLVQKTHFSLIQQHCWYLSPCLQPELTSWLHLGRQTQRQSYPVNCPSTEPGRRLICLSAGHVLSSSPRTHMQRLGVVACVCNPSAREADTEGSAEACRPGSLDHLVSSRPSERAYLKKQDDWPALTEQFLRLSLDFQH